MKNVYEINKSLKSKLSLLGKRVRRPGKEKEGIIVISSYTENDYEYFIMYKNGDLESLLGGMTFEIYCDTKNKFIKDPENINVFFNLTKEELDFLNIKNNLLLKV